jgi:hypothetical protein
VVYPPEEPPRTIRHSTWLLMYGMDFGYVANHLRVLLSMMCQAVRVI